jgi:glucose-1-phosphate adenylyltransferase
MYPNISMEGVYLMGADYYETMEEQNENRERGIPNLGLGEDSHIRGAILDKNVRIGRGCRIGVDQRDRPDGDFGTHLVVDGIIVVPKNTIIPDGTII